MSEHLAVNPEMTYLQARQVVHAFANTVIEFSGTIADENRLPFPKAVIKQATLMVLPFAPSDEVRKHLRHCYLCLADFQPGVGEQPVTALPVDAESPKNSEELAAAATRLERWLPWSKRSTAETLELLRELQDAGFRGD